MPFPNGFWEAVNLADSAWARAKTQTLYRLAFRSMGGGTSVWSPQMLRNTRFARLGANVLIRSGARIELIIREGDNNKPNLTIQDCVTIEQNLHLSCAEEIVIKERATISSNVGIWDVWHTYDDPAKPIILQPIKTSKVSIGEGSLVGTGCVILPGVSIGRNCVIGANSVVTKSVPDYSVAVGAPARVVKQYDVNAKKWINVGQKGC